MNKHTNNKYRERSYIWDTPVPEIDLGDIKDRSFSETVYLPWTIYKQHIYLFISCNNNKNSNKYCS